MEGFVRDHEESVKKYERRVADLQTKLGKANKSTEALSSELCSMEEEVEVLTQAQKEANAAAKIIKS